MAERSYIKKASSPKVERLEARVTREQKELLQRAANLTGRSLSDFVVDSAQRAAQEAIYTHEVIELTEQDSRAFADAILDPPKPSAGLRRAAARYLAEVEER